MDQNKKNEMFLSVKEDELWMALRERKEEMEKFMENLDSEFPSPKDHALILLCFRIIMAKSTLEMNKWDPLHCSHGEFSDLIIDLFHQFVSPTKEAREELRKIMWGYTVAQIELIHKMTSEYMGEIEPQISSDYIYEKASFLYNSVIITYIESTLREIEYIELTDSIGENNE